VALVRAGVPDGEPNAANANASGPGLPLQTGAFSNPFCFESPLGEPHCTMAVSQSYLDYVIDQLSGYGPVYSKRMFGGVGLYSDDIFFGLIHDDVLYLKVDDRTRGQYEAAGSEPFRPYGEGSRSMSYYAVPIHVLEDIDAIKGWTRTAVSVAQRQLSAKSQRKARARTRPKKGR